MTTVQSIDKIPDSLGYLIIQEDGAVLNSGGELENNEHLATTVMQLVQSALRLPFGDRPSHFRRLCVMWESYMYAITISNHRIYVCKKKYFPQEALNV